MTFFLTTLPLWLSAVILIVPTTLLAMAGPVIVRRYVEVNQLRTNNEVAGFKFGTRNRPIFPSSCRPRSSW